MTGKREIRWFGLLSLGLALSLSAFDMRPGVSLTMTGFRTRGGSREDGGTDWEIKGARAVVRGVLAELEKLELTFFLREGETATITSPRCSFNQADEVGRSDAPIKLESRTMKLEGVGYDILVNEHRVRVRSNVKMRIRLTRRAAGLWRSVAPGDDAADTATESNHAPEDGRDGVQPDGD